MQSPSNVAAALFDWASLPKVTAPFITVPPPSDKPYTLVLDLDETLIHFVDNGHESYYLKRPGCIEFLQEMSVYFELVIFTAAMQDYADNILDQLDPDHSMISHRLYRQHTTLSNG